MSSTCEKNAPSTPPPTHGVDTNVINQLETKGSTFTYMFNKFFADYILMLRRTDPAVKEALKKHYKSIDDLASTTEHLEWFGDNVRLDVICGLLDAYATKDQQRPESALTEAATDNMYISFAKGVDWTTLIANVCKDDVTARDKGVSPEEDEDSSRAVILQILSYLCLLSCLHHFHTLAFNSINIETKKGENDEGENDEGAKDEEKGGERENGDDANADLEVQLHNMLSLIPCIQNGEEGVEPRLNELRDERVRDLLSRMGSYEANLRRLMQKYEESSTDENDQGNRDEGGEGEGEGEGEGQDFADMFARFKDSKLGKLATEITDELDVSKLNVDNPMEMLDFSNIGNKDSALGSIVDKMSSKVKSKMEGGELKYEELIGEAVNLFKGIDLGAIQNNPIFAAMMNNAGGGGGGGGTSHGGSGSRGPRRTGGGSGSGSRGSAGPSSSSSTVNDRLRRKLAERKNK